MGLHSYLTTLMILRHSNANAITKGKMRDSVAQETVSNKYYLNQIFPGEIDKLNYLIFHSIVALVSKLQAHSGFYR